MTTEGDYWDYRSRMFYNTIGQENEYLENRLRPSTRFKPKLFIDGNQWCALYGTDLQNGVAGFGDSPESAYTDFDEAWTKKIREVLAVGISLRRKKRSKYEKI